MNPQSIQNKIKEKNLIKLRANSHRHDISLYLYTTTAEQEGEYLYKNDKMIMMINLLKYIYILQITI